MSHPRLIQPHSRPLPTGPPAPADALADDFALESARRLRVVCLVCIGLWTIMLTVNHLITPRLHLAAGQVIPWPPIADILALGSIALSAAVYRLAPIAARRGAPLLKIGIGYQI